MINLRHFPLSVIGQSYHRSEMGTRSASTQYNMQQDHNLLILSITFPAGFHEAMYTAEDLCTPVPLERWDTEALSAEDDVLRSNMLQAAYFLDRVDRFDDGAFRQSKSEAVAMDPQTRILLEQSYTALQVSRGMSCARQAC